MQQVQIIVEIVALNGLAGGLAEIHRHGPVLERRIFE
jgi:hypothetical protein